MEDSMTDDSASVVLRMNETFNAATRDLDAYAALYSVDCEITDTASGEVFRGPEGARQQLESYLISFPDAHEEIVHMIVQGEWVAIEAFEHGTHTGTLTTADGDGVRPTGKSIKIPFCDILEVKNGKIVQRRDQFNWTLVEQQLGLTPERS
jgi:predicted ester cyclase